MAAVALTNSPSGGYIQSDFTSLGVATADILRIDVAGNETAVRNGDPATVSGGEVIINDYECPIDGTQVKYEARNVSTGAAIVTSSLTTLDPPANSECWLGHPGIPTLNMTVTVKNHTPGTYRSRSTTHDVIGRSKPVVLALRRSAASGQLVVRIDNETDMNALLDLLDDGSALLFRAPTGWGIGTKYMSIQDVAEDRADGNIATDALRNVTLPYIVVDRPAGLAQAGAGFRWADVISTYSSWTALRAANATWSDVINGIP